VKNLFKASVILFAYLFLSTANAEVNEKILGKAEGYPNNCDYPKGEYTKCIVSYLTANYPSDTKIVKNVISKGNTVRELVTDTTNLKSRLDGDFKRMPYMAMLVVKDGKLIYENYQYNKKSTDQFLYFSMTKSMVALSVGKAIELGYITSVNDPASKYLPELASSPYYQITIKNLLQMETGVSYKYDQRSPNSDTTTLKYVTLGYSDQYKNLTEYFNQYKPSRKNDEQGKYFNYDDNATNVLAMIVKNATKKPLNEFFSETIWSKIGAESNASWQGNQQGDLIGHGGFYSTPRDLARFGLVLLNDGKYLDTQVIPSSWIKTQFSPLVKADKNQGGEYYGYQTWVLDSSGNRIAFKGHLGQTMMMDKTTNTLLITFGVDLRNEYWEDLHRVFDYVSR
jgi:hypothetical protein